MTSEVEEAVREIRENFAGHEVTVKPDKDGGAVIIVAGLPVGDQFDPTTSWCGFHITFQYPRADVYPHYFDGRLARKAGGELGESFSKTKWNEQDVTQVSRKANRHNAFTDTAALKLAKVLAWVRSR